MTNEILLGVNNYGELVFGEYEIRTRNEFKEFSASFNTVRPFNGDKFDLEEYCSYYIDEFDDITILSWLKKYDCAPSELGENLAEECCDIRYIVDCSIYPECYKINGNDWYFESVGCGQHDTRKEGMYKYTNKEIYDLLHDLWDNYHLEEIDEVAEKKIDKLEKLIKKENINEEEWIVSYIENNIKDYE